MSNFCPLSEVLVLVPRVTCKNDDLHLFSNNLCRVLLLIFYLGYCSLWHGNKVSGITLGWGDKSWARRKQVAKSRNEQDQLRFTRRLGGWVAIVVTFAAFSREMKGSTDALHFFGILLSVTSDPTWWPAKTAVSPHSSSPKLLLLLVFFLDGRQ